jgi:hypothetical protein
MGETCCNGDGLTQIWTRLAQIRHKWKSLEHVKVSRDTSRSSELQRTPSKFINDDEGVRRSRLVLRVEQATSVIKQR